MAFPTSTEKESFDQRFLFAIRYKGETCNSLDEIITKFKHDYRFQLEILDCKLTPEQTDEFTSVSQPFSYVTAEIGSKEITNLEYLGFKLDSEPFIRLGPPHLEPSREKVCFGEVDGYKLYESPEKKHELLSHRSL